MVQMRASHVGRRVGFGETRVRRSDRRMAVNVKLNLVSATHARNMASVRRTRLREMVRPTGANESVARGSTSKLRN